MRLALLLLATLFAGYAAGRIRPWIRLADRAEDSVLFGSRVSLPVFGMFALTHPRRAWRGWRHRHDAPAPLAQVNPEFFLGGRG